VSRIWDGTGAVLVDTSAWAAARRQPSAQNRLRAAAVRGDVAWCWPVRYELMVDARDPHGIAAVDQSLEGIREVAVDRAVQRGVLSVMRELAAGGSHGAHRIPLTDLTVAVAAQRAGLDILHYDRHFDRLAELLGVRAWWVSAPG